MRVPDASAPRGVPAETSTERLMASRAHPATVTDMIDQTTPDLFLAALSLRDFGRLADCLAPSAQARMLLPSGAVTRSGRDEIAGAFEGWFAHAGEFVVLDAGCQTIGRRNLLSWRFRMSRNGQGPEVIEQLAGHRPGARRCV